MPSMAAGWGGTGTVSRSLAFSATQADRYDFQDTGSGVDAVAPAVMNMQAVSCDRYAATPKMPPAASVSEPALALPPSAPLEELARAAGRHCRRR
ncbi:MAG: hypothetical protein U1F25_00820 [Rubrivivax sp.]